jgi:hypothetical protein
MRSRIRIRHRIEDQHLSKKDADLRLSDADPKARFHFTESETSTLPKPTDKKRVHFLECGLKQDELN